MEQPDQLAAEIVLTREIRPLMPIAMRARVSQILQHRLPTMLPSNDMVDRKR